MRALIPLARRAAAAAATRHSRTPTPLRPHLYRALCASSAETRATAAPTTATTATTAPKAQPDAVTDTAAATSEATPTSGSDVSRSPTGLTTDDIFEQSANRATRYVFLRTMPLRQQEELSAGDIDSLAAAIEAGARVVVSRHLWRVTDDRAAVHLHTTALAIATHRTLLGRLPGLGTGGANDDGGRARVENVIRAAFGAKLKHDPSLSDEQNVLNEGSGDLRLRPDYWVVRTALWFARDKMGAVARMTENMVRDFGATFDTTTDDARDAGVHRHVVTVRRCFYDDVCRAEGLPHLTHVFCALDRAMYSALNGASHGVRFSLDRTLADDGSEPGDSAGRGCEFRFEQEGK